jgi:predicted O-methyltransferase YrrM
VRLRQIPPETGKLLALLAASAPQGEYLEIGTSAGYSALWITLALRPRGLRLITFDVDPEKVKLAQETFSIAGFEQDIQVIQGDARDDLTGYARIAFCFIDTEKEIYQDCYDLAVPNLAPGGLLIADNVISHAQALEPFINRALADRRVDGVVVPIGQGVLLCRKN